VSWRLDAVSLHAGGEPLVPVLLELVELLDALPVELPLDPPVDAPAVAEPVEDPRPAVVSNELPEIENCRQPSKRRPTTTIGRDVFIR